MPDLGDEGGNTLGAHDLESDHGCIQHRNKNAGLAAGVREDLQQLLLSDWHNLLQTKRNRPGRVIQCEHRD